MKGWTDNEINAKGVMVGLSIGKLA